MYLPSTMPPQTVSFLPSTCLFILDRLDDAHVEREHSRLKHLIVNTKKTRSKETTSSKKDQLKHLLLNSCVEAVNDKSEEECSIKEAISILSESLNTHLSSQRQTAVQKDVSTSTCDLDVSQTVNSGFVSQPIMTRDPEATSSRSSSPPSTTPITAQASTVHAPYSTVHFLYLNSATVRYVFLWRTF